MGLSHQRLPLQLRVGGSAYQNGDGTDAGKAALMSTQVWLPLDAIQTSSGNYEAGGWMEESEAQERDWVMNVELSLVTGSTHNMRLEEDT